MAISREFIQELHERLDIESVVSSYIELKHTGKNLKGLCPFHAEKTPSFTVFPATDSFFCFGCKASGDIISFIMRYENLDYVEAVKKAAEMAGMNMPDEGYDDSLEKRRRRVLSANREAARFYHACLKDEKNRHALNYFLDRGLTPATIARFGLGYATGDWEDLTRHLKSLGYSEQELVIADLAKRSKKTGGCYDSFRNRVIFPILDVRGNVVAFGARVLDDSKPKYLNTGDTPVYKKGEGVFALNYARNNSERKLILVEGYMDAITLHQAGFENAIAGQGTALTNRQVNLISKYADEVLLCYDSDGPGRKAAASALEMFERTPVNVRMITIDAGKDADELIRTYGAERFRRLISDALNETEYRLFTERDKYDLKTDDGKLKYLNACAGILAGCSPVEREIYIIRLSDEFGISKETITAQVNLAGTKKAKAEKREEEKRRARELLESFEDKNNPEKKRNIRAASAEETLTASLMRNPDFYAKLKDKFSPDDFVTAFGRRMIECLISLIEEGCSTDPSMFTADFTPAELDSVYRIYSLRESLANTLKECEDCIRVLKEEKSKTDAPESESDEDWAAAIRKMGKKKKDSDK